MSEKPSNPKDLIGSNKVPLHLWPEAASALGALALLDGALKYGRTNWRAVGVKATIYVDALHRHVGRWFEGEDVDPDSGLPHLAHALACLAIIVDAQAAGKLVDDRAYPGGFQESLAALTPHVERLKAKYADKAPKHYTIADVRPSPCECGPREVCQECPPAKVQELIASSDKKVEELTAVPTQRYAGCHLPFGQKCEFPKCVVRFGYPVEHDCCLITMERL